MQYNVLIRSPWDLISFIKYSKLKSVTYDQFLKLLLLLLSYLGIGKCNKFHEFYWCILGTSCVNAIRFIDHYNLVFSFVSECGIKGYYRTSQIKPLKGLKNPNNLNNLVHLMKIRTENILVRSVKSGSESRCGRYCVRRYLEKMTNCVDFFIISSNKWYWLYTFDEYYSSEYFSTNFRSVYKQLYFRKNAWERRMFLLFSRYLRNANKFNPANTQEKKM